MTPSLAIAPIVLIFAGLVALVILVALFIPIFTLLWKLIRHVGLFFYRMASDILRAIGAVVAAIVFVPIILGSIIIGRWSAASHFGRAWQGEVKTLGVCLYRVALSHPLRLLGLHSIVAGLEERVPQALADAPGPDAPSRRTGQFEGYSIVGSLPGGGSGSKLYIAEPDDIKLASLNRAGHQDLHRVVIKSFSLADGSSLPQIIRESRSLEAAKRMGLVLDHDQTNERFFYVMRYVPGQPLGAVVQALHAESEPNTPPGLDDARLKLGLGYVCDLLRTLDAYHRGGLWHKDVKPDNIVVDGTVAHLVDFGLLTHLRSAMTLTTHGTEYFRDPELVRMALRGVKVHEVDGVLFDVYAAGAVLYSVIENSFPAHGALSQVSARCPDAVKWIIRRAMTDYDKRYRSASDMLADVSVVAAAQFPMSVRPVALPSMGGERVAPQDAHTEASPRAGSPIPPPVPPFTPPGSAPPSDTSDFKHRVAGLAAAAAKLAEEAVHKAEAAVQQAARKSGLGVDPAKPSPREIKVRNWWTGSFEVSGQSPARQAGSTPPIAPIADVRAAAYAPANTPPVIPTPSRSRFGAAASEFVVRRPAHEQLKSAQARIKSARQRVETRLSGRRRSRPQSSPAGFNGGIAFALIAALGLIGAGLYQLQSGTRRSVTQTSQGPMITIQSFGTQTTESAFFESPDSMHIEPPTFDADFFGTMPANLYADQMYFDPNSIEIDLPEVPTPEEIAEIAFPDMNVLVVSDVPAPWSPQYENFLRGLISIMQSNDVALQGDVFDLLSRAAESPQVATNADSAAQRAAQIEILATLRAQVAGLPVGSEEFAQRIAAWLDERDDGLDAVIWLVPASNSLSELFAWPAGTRSNLPLQSILILPPASQRENAERLAEYVQILVNTPRIQTTPAAMPAPAPAQAPLSR